jgi:dihydroflavonol-4-reductase
MVVVTGASGLIGNVLVRELVARGQQVRALTHSRKREVSLQEQSVEIVPVGVGNLSELERAFEGADVVFHLAAMVSVAPVRTRQMYRVNVRGTQNVIEACRSQDVRQLVYVSSTDALALPPAGSVLSESMPLEPERTANGYGRSKARATTKVLDAALQGLDAVVLYPSSVVGPFDFKPTQIGQAILDYAHRRVPAYLEGAYDFVDVRDVAQGIIGAGEKGKRGEGYILSGTRLSVHELMLILERLTGVKAPVLKLPLWLARMLAVIAPVYYALRRTEPLFTPYTVKVLTKDCLMSSEKARRALGFTTRPIRETLEDTVRWFRERGRI